MNKERRKELYAIAVRLTSFKNGSSGIDIEDVRSDLEMVLCDEETYMDNMPENLQNGYRYQVAEEACTNMEFAIDALDDGNIDDAINYIYSATA